MISAYYVDEGAGGIVYWQERNVVFCDGKPLLPARCSHLFFAHQGPALFAITPQGQGVLAPIKAGSLGRKQPLSLPAATCQAEEAALWMNAQATGLGWVQKDGALFWSDFSSPARCIGHTNKAQLLCCTVGGPPAIVYPGPDGLPYLSIFPFASALPLSSKGQLLADASILWLGDTLHLLLLLTEDGKNHLYYRHFTGDILSDAMLLSSSQGLIGAALYQNQYGLFASAYGQDRLIYTFSTDQGHSFFPVTRHYVPLHVREKAQILGNEGAGEIYLDQAAQPVDTGFFRPKLRSSTHLSDTGKPLPSPPPPSQALQQLRAQEEMLRRQFSQAQAEWGSEQPDLAVVSLFIAGELD